MVFIAFSEKELREVKTAIRFMQKLQHSVPPFKSKNVTMSC